MRILKVSLVVGGLIASAVIAGGTAVAAPSNAVAAKAECSVKVDKGHAAPVVDDHGYPVGHVHPKLAKGTTVKSACSTRTTPSGPGRYCGGSTDKLIKLMAGQYSGLYVPSNCVTLRR
ncbi:hypothetical protein [Allokutzneria sp. NRRL B-24872]|uniref:hypothetical protein n=1 Tax=Allokutzneria sp. NRRL B-24872 TaxID=1137961 RepID=UPI000A389955|nr:hypothetical protein [Allokutzneria sp. NRRL B-24872]